MLSVISINTTFYSITNKDRMKDRVSKRILCSIILLHNLIIAHSVIINEIRQTIHIDLKKSMQDIGNHISIN